MDKSKVIKANIIYHSALAEDYTEKQPHFKTENIKRVEGILADMAARTGGNSLLDLGCGTGFIINIAVKYFRRVVGVDITPAMIKKVDTGSGKVELLLTSTDNLPFGNNVFDVCTASSFLHHLYDLRPTLKEAYRCLRSGGLLYSDQDPNNSYWWLMNSIKNRTDLTGIVDREVRSVVYDVEEVISETGLTPEVVKLAEYQMKKGGFDADEISSLLQEAGFRSVKPHYEWFFGQGKVLHQQSSSDVKVIESFLREGLPATRHLFKYLSFLGEK